MLPLILDKAQVRITTRYVFFSYLLLTKLPLKEDPKCKTAWTDGRCIGYNPTWFTSLPEESVTFVLLHEIMHCVLKHQLRQQERDNKVWNMACDYVVNEMLTTLLGGQTALPMPPEGLLNRDFFGKSEEEIYNILMRQSPPKEKERPQGGGDEGEDSEEGEAEPWDFGQVRSAPGEEGKKMTSAEMGRELTDWNIAIGQANVAAKMHGQCPAGLDRMVGDLTRKRVNWKEYLWKFVNATCKTDYTMSRPNLRFLSRGLYLPSLRGEALERIGLFVDTSGSMSAEALGEAATEMTSILQTFQTEALVIYCDTDLKVEEVSSDQLPLDLHPAGGGGTSFVPPFEYVEENQERVACVIYITDGWCNDFPKEVPGYPVLWLVLENKEFGEAHYNPGFGDVIYIGE